jgi:hypothetical protein
MRANKNIWAVPIPTSIIKRMEGVFVANGVRYFTPEGKDHTKSAVYFISKERTGTRQLINLSDLWHWIQSNDLESEIATELNTELTNLNTTLWDWFNDNKVRRSEIIERE